MAYTIKQDIVVPFNYVKSNSGLVPPFSQVHLHSTGNPRASVQNERDYLAGHYNEANYTHLVGITNGEVDIRQVMNTNGGAWDVGGDWNWDGHSSIEFAEGSIQSQDDFNKAYPAYIWLARQLAKEAGAGSTIDDQNTSGTKTHNYASATGHGSDHTDPIAFLAKWGVSSEKLNADIVNGIGDDSTPIVVPTATPQVQPEADTSAIQVFKNAGNKFILFSTFRVDEIQQINGIWQMINYNLAGGRDFSWTNNGIPLDIVDNVTRGNYANTQVGDLVRFNSANNQGAIDEYDNASNAVGIKFGQYGMIWFNADAFIKL
ncbi:lytic exoenzyme target recognition domain-containing protein [Leuconostoc holzapfelii]|uniref:N-acetylmuramoyl-L-alanine amidase n=1 Tax=Leuconostoc holzapfelii TaxID=434464 RepID=A0A846ZIK8_9LACO|nr:lytic exoenzyme target recognition domain-containing protein [Leuconostoc holzapfelii]NKZ18853.1 N-acetylmuramoyl-L-alanine amidase [Leuconostoc holzapfelii]